MSCEGSVTDWAGIATHLSGIATYFGGNVTDCGGNVTDFLQNMGRFGTFRREFWKIRLTVGEGW